MNITTMENSCTPPPLPAEANISPDIRSRPGHLRQRPLLLLSAVGAAVAADATLWTGDGLSVGYGGYGAALGGLLGASALAAMRRDLDFRRPEWGLLASAIVASVIEGGWLSVALSAAAPGIAVSRPAAQSSSVPVAPAYYEAVSRWADELACAVRDAGSRVFRGRGGAWAAALVVGAFFLILLATGNAALAKYLEDVTGVLRRAIDLDSADIARVFFWCAGILVFGVFAAGRPTRMSERAYEAPSEKAAPVPLAALLGANLAFLASNLVDTYWLGLRRGAPEGVSTTEYLYSGAYALMADAAVAAALLLFLFRNGGAARGSRAARWAGVALAAQCAWLGLGVAGRLALQMNKFGFTPVRVWGVVLLVWGAVGIVGVVRHLRGVPSPLAFARLSAWSALGLLALVQFRPPAVLSVDLNLALFAARPEWRFDDAYHAMVGAEGRRLSEAVAKAEPNTARGVEERARIEQGRAGSGARLDWRVRSLRRDGVAERYLAGGGESADNGAR